jgi:uncharacterized protein YkwD
MKSILLPSFARFMFVGLSLSSVLSYWCASNFFSTAWAAPVAPQVVTLAPPTTLTQAVQQLALELVNRDRIAEGLPPMKIDAQLSQAAQKHAEDMLQRNYFSHYSPEGQTPTDRLAAVGRVGYPAENIAMDEDHSRHLNIRLLEGLEKRWMQSPKHRHSLMNPHYEQFGYGLAVDRKTGRVFAVQMFSRP